MIFKEMMLAWYGTGGGEIGNMLVQWEQAGFFSYILPFLLIFALVYGILSKTKIFDDHKAINGVIAVVVGMLSIQFGVVSAFFSEIFPRMGVGIAILLVAIIFAGMFFPSERWSVYTLFGVGAVILLVVLYKTAGAFNWTVGYWWSDNWPTIIGIIFILAVIGIIVSASTPETDKPKFHEMKSLFFGGPQATA